MPCLYVPKLYVCVALCACPSAANQDPIAVIMGPTFASSAGVSNALLDAHERLTREKARGDGTLADELDASFKLLLLLNALDVRLLHNSVQKLGKCVRMSRPSLSSYSVQLEQCIELYCVII